MGSWTHDTKDALPPWPEKLTLRPQRSAAVCRHVSPKVAERIYPRATLSSRLLSDVAPARAKIIWHICMDLDNVRRDEIAELV
jgi:hypothetical protein